MYMSHKTFKTFVVKLATFYWIFFSANHVQSLPAEIKFLSG